MKEVQYAKAAARALNKMPLNTALRIRGKINDYAADPGSQANNIKALKGTDWIRLRVGNWRVIMADGFVLEIVEIGPRGSVYD